MKWTWEELRFLVIFFGCTVRQGRDARSKPSVGSVIVTTLELCLKLQTTKAPERLMFATLTKRLDERLAKVSI